MLRFVLINRCARLYEWSYRLRNVSRANDAIYITLSNSDGNGRAALYTPYGQGPALPQASFTVDQAQHERIEECTGRLGSGHVTSTVSWHGSMINPVKSRPLFLQRVSIC